jgi:hypothetical protein
MDEYKVFSSGGVGDSLIVGLKIRKMRQQNGDCHFIWEHREKHACHKKPCHDIMGRFAEEPRFILCDQPEKEAMEAKAGCKGYYIDTRINSVVDPYLDFPIGSHFLKQKRMAIGKSAERTHWDGNLSHDIEDFVVVQCQAGRMHDNTKRTIGSDVIKQLRQCLPDQPVVLLGPEPVNFHEDGICNWTGQTVSILDAFSCIDECAMFVGQDGVLAYYAMMRRKPTLVAYHLPNLPGHYWNNAWASHSLALMGAGNHLRAIPANDKTNTLMALGRKRV